MPEFVISVDTSEGRRRFAAVADSLKDLTPVLREFDKYKRGKIQELFDTQGHGKWPPLSQHAQHLRAAAEQERVEQAPHTLARKLVRELKRARQRAERKAAREGLIRTHLTASGRAANKKRQNTVARRAFVLKAFEDLIAGGAESRPDLAGFESDDRRLQKSVRGLEARLQRAYARAAKTGRPLGNLYRTIRSTVKNGLLTIDSAWNSPAVRALNDGATTGHGAKLPARPFLFWDAEDVDYLIGLLKARSMLAWSS